MENGNVYLHRIRVFSFIVGQCLKVWRKLIKGWFYICSPQPNGSICFVLLLTREEKMLMICLQCFKIGKPTKVTSLFILTRDIVLRNIFICAILIDKRKNRVVNHGFLGAN